jgi:GNAT superfamily N-acetyltransferase
MPDTQLDIRVVEQLSPEESHHLFGWGENIFDTAHLNLTYRAKDSRDRRFVLYDETLVPVSHAGVLRHHAHANGRPVLIGGVGGVVTVPGARGRGHAGQLLRHAAAFLRDEWKADFALLFCIDQRVGFYQRLEWAEVSCEVLIDQPDGKIPCPFHVMTLAFTPEFSRIETLDLGSPSW